MDAIGSLRGSVTNTASAKPNTRGVDNVAESRNMLPRDQDGDTDNSIGRSNVTISADALKLSSTSVTPPVNNQTQIPDQDKAKDVLAKVMEGMQNNPAQAKQALSSVSASNVGRLLAEDVISS